MRVLDAQGNDLDPASVDWHAPRNIMLRQEAGPANPLGQVAIRFANPFSVSLHDTSSKQLFDRTARALSSGRVHVAGDQQLGDLLLDDDERATVARLRQPGQNTEKPPTPPNP